MQVQITLKERPISRTPLVVLTHLYYYTGQYGLAVRHYTGKHQSYWEKLPRRLREARSSQEDLESVIQELEELAAGAEERTKKRRAQKDGEWAKKEVVLNHQLVCVLTALPEDLLALGFKRTMGCEHLPGALRIVDLEMQGPAGEHVDFIEPDVLLLGEDTLLMVEVKARAGARSYCVYPPSQLLKYLHLAAKCRDAEDASLPGQFTHLILVPSTDPKWLERHSEWVLDTSDEGGRLRVNPDACVQLSKRNKSLDYERVKALSHEIPLYYRSWEQLSRAFDSAIQESADRRDFRHWRRIVDEIHELATRAGRYG
jgi:hypothetical protein